MPQPKRYTESADRSSELLRMALQHMGRHDAAFNPITFTVWYEYSAGANPRLSAELDQRLQDRAALDDAAVERLYDQHIAPADEAAVQRITAGVQRLINGITESASVTGDRAGAFGAQLVGLAEALRSNDAHRLAPRIAEALTSTAEMKTSAEALQQQVAASRHEIEQLRGALDRARGEAMHDPLTGVLNRKGFDQRLGAMLAQPPGKGKAHCLVLLDIDHFKRVNDLHGHVMGDRVIQALGEILRGSVTDPRHSTARYGGEEFAILLPESSLAFGLQVAEAVRLRTRAMKIRNRTTQDVLLAVTVSGGVAGMAPGDDATSLVARADAALYRSKNAGRDQISCDPDMVGAC